METLIERACCAANILMNKSSRGTTVEEHVSRALLVDAHLFLQTNVSAGGASFSRHRDDQSPSPGYTVILLLGRYGSATGMQVVGDKDCSGGQRAVLYERDLDFAVFPSMAWHESTSPHEAAGPHRALKLAHFFSAASAESAASAHSVLV